MTVNSSEKKILFKISRDIWISLFLVIATSAVYWQVRNFEFIEYDDNDYITENSYVRSGLSLRGIKWAFTAAHSANWHPVTWLSHILDAEFYGLNAGGHHITSLFFHILNTLLLFQVLRQMTGALWQSGFAAAMFALHPLHAESVAWVSERKDVLSAFFWMLTLQSYLRYVRQPGIISYLPVFIFLFMGLMTKPMLVTLPFIMILLDYSVLDRFRNRKPVEKLNFLKKFSFLFEKIPLIALAVLSCIITFEVQRKWGAVRTSEVYPPDIRILNAFISYTVYMIKVICPYNLAGFYPHPGMNISTVNGIISGLLITGISVLSIMGSKKYPYITVGWFWYIITLIPVIGLIQVGSQSHADRYTYIPLIGLFIMIAWGIADFLKNRKYRKSIFFAISGIFISVLMSVAWIQVSYWKNNMIFFSHILDVTKNNYMAHSGLGLALVQQGNIHDAVIHCQKAIKIKPDYARAYINMGMALATKQGYLNEAVRCLEKALNISPDNVKAHNNLGVYLLQLGRDSDAVACFKKATEIQPDYSRAYYNLGNIFNNQGKTDEAVRYFQTALSISPDSVDARYNLATALMKLGNIPEAIEHLEKALVFKPDDADIHNQLGIALAMNGNIKEAVEHFKKALQIKPDDADILHNLEKAETEQRKSVGFDQ